MENIQSTDLECRLCGKVYKTSAKMKRHFRKRHIGVTKYQCKQCQKYYTDSGSLKTHMASHDASKNPFPCSKCSKTFPTKGQLGQHTPSHEDTRKFVCKFPGCDKKFKWKKGKRSTKLSVSSTLNCPRSLHTSVQVKSVQKGTGTTGPF